MDMPKPTPGHLRLHALAGSWEGEETMHPSPWAPQGSVALGRTQGRVALGGFSVISDYEQVVGDAVTYAGHSVWSYAPKEDTYVLHWFDSMGSPPEEFRGRFEGDVLTVSHGGPAMHARLTYDLSDPSELRSRMEMSQDGKSWNPFFDGRYRRR